MKKTGLLVALFFAFFLAAVCYFHNNVLIDWADEGFLWYGAMQTLQGLVPIRDFQAYDPGRYYWCAAVMSWFGPGILSLRLGAGFFQFVGLCFALMSLRRVIRSPLALLGAGVVAMTWMLLSFRYFDSSMPIIALYFAARLIEKPSLRRFFAGGIFIGLAAFFGINHGVYALAAWIALIAYLQIKGPIPALGKKIAFFLSGILVGLMPFFILCWAAPGFWTMYYERLAVFASFTKTGNTSASLSIAWPWLVSWSQISQRLPTFGARMIEYLNTVSLGYVLIFVMLYTLVSVPIAVGLKKIQEPARALFVASVFVGCAYLVHLFSRANVIYLGESIFPLWAGLLALRVMGSPGALKRWVTAGIIFFTTASFLCAGFLNNIVFKHLVPPQGMAWVSLGKDRIWLSARDAALADGVKKFVRQYVRADEQILLAPMLATFYCLLEKKSPIYELYLVMPPPLSVELRNVRELEQKKVPWALVANFSVDGHEEYALSRSHPLLWQYLSDHFENIAAVDAMPGYWLMKRKS